MTLSNFEDFLSESWSEIDYSARKNAAGVAILFKDMILLVHPTGASWKKSALGIPKGGIEHGEDPLEAAVRELMEETGIRLTIDELIPDPQIVNIDKNTSEISWQLVYFIKRISSLDEIGLTSLRVPKSQLQLHEIDWAGFVKIEEAYSKMHRSQLIILDRAR